MGVDNNLNFPSILPDEIDRGFLGRLMRVNGATTELEIVAQVATRVGLGGLSRKEAPTAMLLGRMLYDDTIAFVRRHTTLPLRRAITSNQSELEHGSESNLTMLNSSALRLAKSHAYFCPDCASEDEGTYGFSYWRREHQMPGLFWCQKHETPLFYCVDPKAFQIEPKEVMTRCYAVPDAWAREAMANADIIRFLTIASYLIERDRPIAVKQVQPVLRLKAAACGLQTTWSRIYAPLLSNLVVQRFGRNWLAAVHPVAAEKKKHEIHTSVDGVLFLQVSASSVQAYIMAMAVLYDSAEEAMNAILAPTPCRTAKDLV